MGKKFKKAVFAVVAIVVSYYTAQPWLGKLLYAYGVSQLANVAISAFTKTRRTQAPPINVTIRGTIEPRRLVFGTRRCGGVLVFYATSGTDNKYLWYVIAYAGHQCSAFGDFWLDERRIDGSLVPAGAGGTVSGFNGRINIWKHLGTSAQTVDTNLSAAFGAWTTSHKLQGICYAVIRFERDDEIFPDGAPQSVSAEIDGMLTYDARLDSTNGGSGAHRYANPSTWAFSRDPVQHVRWFLTGGSVHNDLSTCLKMYGLRELDTRIDDAYTIAASNVCDETLSGANAPPSGSQSRYRCDLETHTGETRREILQALLDSMAGTCVWVHGKWRIYAGHYDAPVHTITDQDLYGDLEVQDTVGHDVRYNAVAPIYFDSASQYIQTSGKYRTDSTYESQDGGERLSKELQLDAVTDIYQAQRLAEIHLRQSRMMRSVRLNGALNLMKIAPYEGALFTHTRYGWTNRILRAKEKGFEAQEEAGKVTVLTQRDDPGVWTDLLTADYDAGTSSTDEFVQDGPETPAGLTATPRTFSIEFVITPPAYMRPGAVIELWEHTASTPFSSATKIADIPGGTTRYLLFRPDTITRYYWIRQRDQQNATSGTFPSSTGLAGVSNAFMWTLIARGTAVVTGPDSFTKVGGTVGYGDADVYTSQGFRGGAYFKFRPTRTDRGVVAGLNSDPLTDEDYTSIDLGWNTDELGQAYAIVAGTVVAGPWSYAVGDRFVGRYDGYYMRFYQNDTLRHTASAGTGKVYFFDSALSQDSAGVTDFSFGPVGQVSDIDLVQISVDATSELVESQPADSTLNFPTYSSGGTFRDVRTITSVSWSNTSGETIDVEMKYAALVSLSGSNPSGAISQWVWGEYDINGGTVTTDGSDSLKILSQTPLYDTRAGMIVVSVANGSTINARLQASMTGPAGTFDPADVLYRGVSLQLKARKR